MVFGLFGGKKKPSLKLEPKQEVEIEFQQGEAYEAYFVPVLETAKKKISLRSPGSERRPVRVPTGSPVTVTALVDNTLYWYTATCLEGREREFDISVPKDVQEEELPPFDENFKVEAVIPVEYRPMNTAHTSAARSYALMSKGIQLTTNLGVPPGTTLLMELEIPGAAEVRAKGKVITSGKHPQDPKKYLTEVEFEDLPAKERDAILRYGVYLRKRQQRKEQRGE
jgi:c-di-GMP-binding flagellar brake protein YcgR